MAKVMISCLRGDEVADPICNMYLVRMSGRGGVVWQGKLAEASGDAAETKGGGTEPGLQFWRRVSSSPKVSLSEKERARAEEMASRWHRMLSVSY